MTEYRERGRPAPIGMFDRAGVTRGGPPSCGPQPCAQPRPEAADGGEAGTGVPCPDRPPARWLAMTVIRPPSRPQRRDITVRWPGDQESFAAPAAQAAPIPRDTGTAFLRLHEIHAHYGQFHALRGVSLTVQRGEIVALLGSNGAGKTTTLRVIHGLVHPSAGSVEFDGRDVSSVATHDLVRLGIGQSPERRRVFAHMSVRENLEMGAYSRSDRGDLAADFDRVFGLFPILRERGRQDAATLSGGEQQMLAMARALMARPRLLLLDEPTMDLAPILVDQIFETLVEINRQGTTILLVEQNARLALQVSARAYVLQTGAVVRAGAARDLADDPKVRAAYLGG